MAPRRHPSERQRRLGAELRKLRTRAGISGDQAAVLLEADRARISNIEAGRIDVSRNRLYMLLREYGCPPGTLFDGLMEMAQGSGKGWWCEYEGVLARRALDLAELESRVTSIRVHDSLNIPGMLQTEEYARAAMASIEGNHENLDKWVRFRMERQRVLAGLQRYHAVICESALRTCVGSAETMRKQLLKLIEVARLPHVTVQIFPFEMGPYSAYSRSFIIMDSHTPELSTLYREYPISADFIGDGHRIAEYARMFERLASMALAPVDPAAAPEAHEARDSLSLLQHALHELR
ncbi:helix-turn-helix domain-containing protein [Streptomyces griseocarneus]|uniref:helix-turn-helix domain-containing protein n=1 Tax=Streptomyces griseocarneus TaxID=51201 RepID=UPI00167D1599|nr:helix-turn-helix transcriptional regulator [Streptomyces griseocarneus]MBZ6474001.1 helix-turn-helix transcriptional regulator [Streptomyces griseocarneus]GHG66281.1 transcriptional regulator [Streptomyces griseocarneus]